MEGGSGPAGANCCATSPPVPRLMLRSSRLGSVCSSSKRWSLSCESKLRRRLRRVPRASGGSSCSMLSPRCVSDTTFRVCGLQRPSSAASAGQARSHGTSTKRTTSSNGSESPVGNCASQAARRSAALTL